jgi:thiaminase/transcriptional activator TenA
MSGAGDSTLRARLWSAMEPAYDAVLNHPFLTELAAGTLDPAAFAFYLTQDSHYLRDYARALSIVGAKAPTDGGVAMFARHAAGAVAVEQALHATLLAELGLDPATLEEIPVAPTNRAYTSYLLSTAYGGSFADGLGAVLPCYWIYWEVGQRLVGRGSPDPRYQRWIDAYAGEEFAAIVAEVLAVVDRLEPTLSPAAEARMRGHVVTTSRYEWMFWDMGYRQERWPV